MNHFSDYLLRHPLPQQHPHQRLTEAECDELFALFDEDSLPDTAMSAEMADGYMTACVIGPVPVPAHEWMQAIFDQPTLPVCTDADKQHRLLQLLLHRHRDITVATAMAPQQVNRETFFLPLVVKVDENNRITPYQLDELATVLPAAPDAVELLDLTGRWSLGSKTEMFASIQNVFDKVAPLDPLTYGATSYNPLDYSGALGRYLSVGFRHKF